MPPCFARDRTASLHVPTVSAATSARLLPAQLTFRILVVDDEPALCELVARMLREAGYMVVTACDAESGWQLVLSGTDAFDLVITDSRLPGMTGREFVQGLREHDPRLPIVHLTGSLRSSAGFPDNVPTLVKPFDLPKLVPTVRDLLAA